MSNGVYEKFATVLSHVCNGLFSIGKDGFGTRRMASVWMLSWRYQNFEELLPQLRDHLCTPDEESKGG